MAEIVHTFLQEHLYRSALVIVICMGALIISMGVDLFFDHLPTTSIWSAYILFIVTAKSQKL